ncbi:Amino-acid transporter arg-13 [Yarrowia sp. C11]|nr:Amino-acid transporter arg-13 [Yarrowia sp. E02]KAG5369375.1 Amino-acid transporter arg-13 [Yarrowia sp. C11]
MSTDSLKDVLYGSVAGATGKVFEYPFDTVKVRLQSQSDINPQFKGPLDCFRQTFRNEGFLGFYRGISSPIFGAAAETASLFVFYGACQRLVKSVTGVPEDKLSMSTLLGCGAVAGALTSFILTPIELIKCQMQVQALYAKPHSAASSVNSSSHKASLHTAVKQPQMGVYELVVDNLKTSGVKGLWKGQMGTLLRETGGSASWFGAYEYVTKFFKHKNGTTECTTVESLLAGAAAGMAYNLSLFPADTIKSRMQTESVTNGSSSGKGFFQVGKEIYQKGGVRALYRGCGITVSRAAPSSAIIFFTYEQLKKTFG